MSQWNHLLCEVCWNRRNPGRPAMCVSSSGPDPCCECGKKTGAGIYIRARASEMTCGGKGPVHVKDEAPPVDPDATLDPSRQVEIPGDTPLPFSRAELQAIIAEELDPPREVLVHETPGPTERQQAARDFAAKYLDDDRATLQAFADFLAERDRLAEEERAERKP